MCIDIDCGLRTHKKGTLDGLLVIIMVSTAMFLFVLKIDESFICQNCKTITVPFIIFYL